MTAGRSLPSLPSLPPLTPLSSVTPLTPPSPPPPAPRPALPDYALGLSQPTLSGGPPAYDEVMLPEGGLRPAWKGLAEVALTLTDSDLHRVDREIRRFLDNDGVSYARPGEDQGPWRLDPLPLVIDAAEWAPLEVGLAQRAELLNAILVDLYGPQRLLSEGVLPPAIVYSHPGFLRVMARASARDPRPLVLAATDLGRDADGGWRVLSDRTQAPSGMGYAMENRRVMSRVLPELYREASLHRMGPFFSALRSALMQCADDEVADPRVVILSPGTHSETAYDQAFVASTLGFPLVQGSDLVVRRGAVWLRSAGRLEPVHVILRRVDASWSDPLELRTDSQLGVPGLTEAVRRGNVTVVNGLGSGVLENPGLLPYLEAACDLLLREPLRLPSVPTWWCGSDDGRQRVLDRLDTLTVRAVDGSGSLTGRTPEQLREQILADPARFVGQERLPLSQAPIVDASATSGGHRDGRVRPQALTLRTFTLRYGSAYRPLVGGLASAAGGGTGGVPTKDVWVLKAEPTDSDQGLGEIMPIATGHAAIAVVPRVLEHMFWIGRYAERSETLLRLLLATHSHAEDFRNRPQSAGGGSLGVLITAHVRLAGPPVVPDDLDGYFRSILLETSRPGSVAQSLASMRDATEGVRDQLSGDVWRALSAIEHAATDLSTSQHSHQVSESAGRMLNGVLAMYGVTANMMRDPGWHMIEAGRALERGLQLSLLLRSATVRRGLDVDRLVLNALLTSSESWVTHRRRYRGYLRPATVLELLLKDGANPRSLAFALGQLRTHLGAMPTSTGSTRPERLLDDVIEHLAEIEVATLVAIGGASRPNLEHYLDGLTEQLSGVGDAIAEFHLAGGPLPRSFGVIRRVSP
ncbi:MAG: circularly permuted type 2 ATP-grasp protein [Lapillicoccus sp.]